jgi:hypothetical protein
MTLVKGNQDSKNLSIFSQPSGSWLQPGDFRPCVRLSAGYEVMACITSNTYVSFTKLLPVGSRLAMDMTAVTLGK